MALEPLRVAIVETSPHLHVAIAELLRSAPDLRIVGHARSLSQLEAFDIAPFDVLVGDLRACLAARPILGQLRGRFPGLRLVVMTPNGGREYQEAIATLAADSWLRKDDIADQLVGTLRLLPPWAESR